MVGQRQSLRPRGLSLDAGRAGADPVRPFTVVTLHGVIYNSVMSTLMDRITVDPQQCGGRPCIRGMRIRVSDVLDLLANGLTPEQVIAELPDLELADVRASLRYASQRISHPVLVA